MSASMRPTLAPFLAKAAAKLTATVDLPTPPFPDATAIIFLTPDSGEAVGSGAGGGLCLCWDTFIPICISTTASRSMNLCMAPSQR